MHKSIEGELTDLRERLGPSPVAPVFAGLAFFRYRVTAGSGVDLIREVGRKTGYRLARAWKEREADALYYELLLDPSLPAMIIHENGRSLEGYPRLDALAFRVTDLQPVATACKMSASPAVKSPGGSPLNRSPAPETALFISWRGHRPGTTRPDWNPCRSTRLQSASPLSAMCETASGISITSPTASLWPM